jgi:hypothetical protein
VSKNPLWIWLDPHQVLLLDHQVSANRKQNVGNETAALMENMAEFLTGLLTYPKLQSSLA